MNTEAAIVLTESVQLGILGIIGTAVAGIFAGVGKLVEMMFETRRTAASAKKDTKETLYQVKNHHTTNLREDLDMKHDTVTAKFEDVDNRLNGHLDRFNHLDRRLDQITDLIVANLTTGRAER